MRTSDWFLAGRVSTVESSRTEVGKGKREKLLREPKKPSATAGVTDVVKSSGASWNSLGDRDKRLLGCLREVALLFVRSIACPYYWRMSSEALRIAKEMSEDEACSDALWRTLGAILV